MGVRVQLPTHLSARVVHTTDTPTSLYCMDTPTSLYDGGTYTGSCIRVMGTSDSSSMRSRYTPYTHPSLYTTPCMHAYGEAHTGGGCAYTNIDDASQDTENVVCTVDMGVRV